MSENDSNGSQSPLSDATTEPWTWALEGSPQTLESSPNIVRTPAVRRVRSSPPAVERPARKARVDPGVRLPSLAEVLSQHRSTATTTTTTAGNLFDDEEDSDSEAFRTPPVRGRRTPPAPERPRHHANPIPRDPPVVEPLHSLGNVESKHRGTAVAADHVANREGLAFAELWQGLPQQTMQLFGQPVTRVHRECHGRIQVYESADVEAIRGRAACSRGQAVKEEEEDSFDTPQKSAGVSTVRDLMGP